MKALQFALVPGAIAGLISIFTSWFWMGLVFHRFQKQTPNTWRPENKGSYAISSIIHFLASIAIATLFMRVALTFGSLFSGGIIPACIFGVLIWGAIAAPFAVDAAVFINLSPLVVLGQLLDWLTTSVVACALAAWWRDT
ncbi:MAG: hypothetical protein M3R10_08795 [Verrucomicrobiota bacterium]|nr:hypothetical protein [Verrucomicrobiota bacterium]